MPASPEMQGEAPRSPFTAAQKLDAFYKELNAEGRAPCTAVFDGGGEVYAIHGPANVVADNVRAIADPDSFSARSVLAGGSDDAPFWQFGASIAPERRFEAKGPIEIHDFLKAIGNAREAHGGIPDPYVLAFYYCRGRKVCVYGPPEAAEEAVSTDAGGAGQHIYPLEIIVMAGPAQGRVLLDSVRSTVDEWKEISDRSPE